MFKIVPYLLGRRMAIRASILQDGTLDQVFDYKAKMDKK